MDKATVEKPITKRDAFGRVIPLCLCALFLAAAVISVTNDMYAFVKPDETVTLTVDQPLDLDGLCDLLGQTDVVKNPFVLKMYLKSKGKDGQSLDLEGQWTLNKNMSYREIMLELWD